MSMMRDVAIATIKLCNDNLNGSVGPVDIKTIVSKTKVSKLVATAGPNGQVTLNGMHGDRYSPASFSSVMPLSMDDVPSMETFLTHFLQSHKLYVSEKKK